MEYMKGIKEKNEGGGAKCREEHVDRNQTEEEVKHSALLNLLGPESNISDISKTTPTMLIHRPSFE